MTGQVRGAQWIEADMPMPTAPPVTPADFISHQAAKLLRDNGFGVHT